MIRTSLLMLLALIGLASGLSAQVADGTTWASSDPLGIIKNPDPYLMNAPGRYLVVKVPEGVFHIQPLELWLDSAGIKQDAALDRAFNNNRVTWPNSLSVRRYDYKAMVAFFKDHLGIKGHTLRYSIKLKGAKMARERRSVKMDEIEILRFPQTWENIWRREVTLAPFEERVARVKAFDTEFREVIANDESKPSWFNRAEQNAFAHFYQSQFNYQRNADPNNPEIYHELAAYHESHDNIDAMIGVYLDAVRHEFDAEAKAGFHLFIGEAMVKRLGLYQEAKVHLEKAKIFAQAHLLLIQCHFALDENAQAVSAAKELAESSVESLKVRDEIDDFEAIQRRAKLLQARAEVAESKLEDAEKAFRGLLESEEHESDEAAWMLASLLVYRGVGSDINNARQAIEKREAFALRLSEAKMPEAQRATQELEYDPLGSKALTIWADAIVDPTIDGRSQGKPNLKNINPVLDYASLLDPLNADPFLVHGKAREAHEMWAEAEASYLEGLKINPMHLGLNYRLGVVYLRGDRFDGASLRLRRCLRIEPDFYHAMNRLAELAIRKAENENRVLQQAKNNGETDLAPFVARIKSTQQEAASFFVNSLSVLDSQSAVRVSLAELYCRLSTLTEEKIALSYLNRAKILAARARRQAEAQRFGEREISRHAVATATPLAANCIFSFASYQLGRKAYNRARSNNDLAAYAEADALFLEAIEALEFIDEPESATHYHARTGSKKFRESDVYAWAKTWRTQMKMNQRRSRHVETFARVVTPETFRESENLGQGWGVQEGDILDGGLKGRAEVNNGVLRLSIDDQTQEGHISRISRADVNHRVANFGVKIDRLGVALIDRGIHMTVVKASKSRGTTARQPVATLMLGIDENYRIFWELRSLEEEGSESAGISLLHRRERIYLDPVNIGTLDENSSLSLEIARYAEEGGKDAIYTLLVNQIAFPIDITKTGGVLADNATKGAKYLSDTRYLRWKSESPLYCGVFMRGREGDHGDFEINEAFWVHDSNLAWEDEEKGKGE